MSAPGCGRGAGPGCGADGTTPGPGRGDLNNC